MKGNYRVVKKFLFFPTSLDGTVTRWLEYAYFLERVELCGYEKFHWVKERFLTSQEIDEFLNKAIGSKDGICVCNSCECENEE